MVLNMLAKHLGTTPTSKQTLGTFQVVDIRHNIDFLLILPTRCLPCMLCATKKIKMLDGDCLACPRCHPPPPSSLISIWAPHRKIWGGYTSPQAIFNTEAPFFQVSSAYLVLTWYFCKNEPILWMSNSLVLASSMPGATWSDVCASPALSIQLDAAAWVTSQHRLPKQLSPAGIECKWP